MSNPAITHAARCFDGLSRRGVLQALLGGTLLGGCAGRADIHIADNFEIIDFHAHALPPRIAAAPPPGANVPSELREIVAKMADPRRVIASLAEQGVNYRILSVPLEAIPVIPGVSAGDRMRRINDAVAELCMKDTRLLGMASIDAFAGEAGADELRRAVDSLGMVGCFVESANHGRLISHPIARPTLTEAAERGLPVFIHPVQESALRDKYQLSGFYQMNLGRAAIASVALAALLESGVFDELPGLTVCVSSFALAAMIIGGVFEMSRPDARELLGKHIYVDTVGLSATMLSTMRDILGTERLLLGTDWPVFSGYSVRHQLIAAATEAGFNAAERNLIAAGNARRIFGKYLDV